MDLREYKNLLDDTYNLYKEYKIDPLNDTLYNSIRLNLSKLDTLVITGKVPSDLIYIHLTALSLVFQNNNIYHHLHFYSRQNLTYLLQTLHWLLLQLQVL